MSRQGTAERRPRAGEAEVEVAIVGGGPVGLYLAARLAGQGVSVIVLEARREPAAHSRAIGIHPPGLAALERIGAAAPLIRRGLAVRRGLAFGGDAAHGLRRLGSLELGRLLPEPYPFVLTVPQPVTEAVLAGRLQERAPAALRRGVRVVRIREDADGVDLQLAGASTSPAPELRARVCVACDGSAGGGARAAGIRVAGARYGDTYLMADATDRTSLGADAAIYLPAAGVVESFPLPGGRRRWVARTERLRPGAEPEELMATIRERLGRDVAPGEPGAASAFGVGWRTAEHLARGRIWLAGDAAHVVSPIGGQGMNLGWLGAEEAAGALLSHLRGDVPLEAAAAAYDAAQRPRARAAIARAAWNMRAGRPTAFPGVRDLLVRAALSVPFSNWSARLFTMQA